jgi:phage terminase large subunit-like protein
MPTAKKAPAKKAAPKRKSVVKKTVAAAVLAVVSLVRPEWTTACPDWTARIVAGETLTPCKPLFQSSADTGMAVFDQLQMVSAGITFGDTRPWVREFAASIFGSYCDVPGHVDEGRRLIRTFFMLISKKNGKSETAGAIMLTALILNWRQEAEFLILSPTKEVADNSFKPMKAAIEADEELQTLFHVQAFTRTITHKITKATLKVVAADSQTVVGKKATGVLVDELHEFGKVAKAEDMLVEATGGLMSRPEGFVIYLTTQSSEPPAGVFKKELDYARDVRDGKIVDPAYMPIIYEFPDEYRDPATKPYLKPENWYIVNPNLGASVDPEFLAQKIAKAGHTGEDSIQSIISKHLNIQIGLDLSADAWPAASYWLSATYNRLGLSDRGILDTILRDCEVITAGIDGGGLDDLLALTFTGRIKGTTDRYLSWSHCWCHVGVLKLRQEIAPRLQDFAAAGELTIVNQLGDDTQQLTELLTEVYQSDLLAYIGVDPARMASIKKKLEEAGLPVDDDKFFVKVRQGWTLYSAILWVERALAEGRYKHGGQSVVNWAVGNAKVVTRANSMLVTKEVSGKAKIDPVMSSFCAAEVMSYNPAARTGGFSLDGLTMMG